MGDLSTSEVPVQALQGRGLAAEPDQEPKQVLSREILLKFYPSYSCVEQTKDQCHSRQEPNSLVDGYGELATQVCSSADDLVMHASARQTLGNAVPQLSQSADCVADSSMTQCTPSVSGTQAEVSAQLEKLVAGMGQVVERARLWELSVPERGICAYAQSICEWIINNDALDGKEILENVEEVVQYASMKNLSVKRFKEALIDQYGQLL